MPVTLSSTMKQISLISYPRGGQPNLWGVDDSESIYRYTGGSWTKIPGGLSQVSISKSGVVWGVNSWGGVYRYDTTSPWSWTRMPGTLAQVEVADNNGVWGLDAAGKVFRYDATANSWSPIAGTMKQLSACYNPRGGNWYLWGIDTTGHVCQYDFNNNWYQCPNNNTSGTMVEVNTTDAMSIYALDSAGQMFAYQGSPNWWAQCKFPPAKYMSKGRDGSTALIDTSGNTIVYDNYGN
ncbi:tectonin domain-containing protein [Nocardia sp. NPDC101769]|uniref:tectonin domain-containing protein n=1 Tax=Nocardia sp. NPDC101769 TaxID=3364333 RepID=UPI00380C5BB6